MKTFQPHANTHIHTPTHFYSKGLINEPPWNCANIEFSIGVSSLLVALRPSNTHWIYIYAPLLQVCIFYYSTRNWRMKRRKKPFEWIFNRILREQSIWCVSVWIKYLGFLTLFCVWWFLWYKSLLKQESYC